MLSGQNQSQVLVGLLLVAGIVIVSCGRRQVPLQRFQPVADFTLTERSGKALRLSDLRGQIWVAEFFFSSCAAECLIQNQRMQEIQSLTENQPDIKLVSFSVDPGTDTPARLRKYAKRWQADPQRWFFVTGEKEPLYDLIQKSFLLPAAETDEERAIAGGEFIHSEKFALVDRQGVVRAYFNGIDPRTPQAVLLAIRQLQAER